VDGVPVAGGATHGVGTQGGGMAELGKAALLVGDQGTRPWKPEGGTEGGVDGGGFSFSFFRTSKGMKCKNYP
jgi:hypothetical protein